MVFYYFGAPRKWLFLFCLDSDVCQLIWCWRNRRRDVRRPPCSAPSAYRNFVSVSGHKRTDGVDVSFSERVQSSSNGVSVCLPPVRALHPAPFFFCQISDSSAATAADRKQTQAATVARLVVGFIAVVCPSPPLLIVCCCCLCQQTQRRLFLCQIDSTFVWLG